MNEENLKKSSKILKEILGLEREPVAVKFFKDDIALNGFKLPSARRYCQFLMCASEGESLILNKENISCPAAAWALGLREPPTKLKTGEMTAEIGIFASPEAAKNTLATMSRIKMGSYRMVALCPLSDSPFNPDIVVIESSPEHLMWLALASAHEKGGRLYFNTAILQATCVDITVIPFLTQKMNMSLGCYGCREATNLAANECVLGFPFNDLIIVLESLEKLNEKVIPRARSKPVYKALLSR